MGRGNDKQDRPRLARGLYQGNRKAMMTQDIKKDRRQFQVAKRAGDGLECPATASAGGQSGFLGGEEQPAMQ